MGFQPNSQYAVRFTGFAAISAGSVTSSGLEGFLAQQFSCLNGNVVRYICTRAFYVYELRTRTRTRTRNNAPVYALHVTLVCSAPALPVVVVLGWSIVAVLGSRAVL